MTPCINTSHSLREWLQSRIFSFSSAATSWIFYYATSVEQQTELASVANSFTLILQIKHGSSEVLRGQHSPSDVLHKPPPQPSVIRLEGAASDHFCDFLKTDNPTFTPTSRREKGAGVWSPLSSSLFFILDTTISGTFYMYKRVQH